MGLLAERVTRSGFSYIRVFWFGFFGDVWLGCWVGSRGDWVFIGLSGDVRFGSRVVVFFDVGRFVLSVGVVR